MAKLRAAKGKPKKVGAAKKKTVKKAAKKKTIKQTGTSNKVYDKRLQALKPGKRKTANPHKYRGKTIKKSTTYTENRENRSDKGRLLGIGNISIQVLKDYENVINKINKTERHILEYNKMQKNKAYNLENRKSFSKTKLFYKKYLSELKSQKSELKKLL